MSEPWMRQSKGEGSLEDGMVDAGDDVSGVVQLELSGISVGRRPQCQASEQAERAPRSNLIVPLIISSPFIRRLELLEPGL